MLIVCDAVLRTFLAAVSVKKIGCGRYSNVRIMTCNYCLDDVQLLIRN